MPSAEHDFVAKEIGDALSSFSHTGLLGLTEADRRSYDYACRVDRDFTRSLVAQVCWGNTKGINKDLEHLLLGSDAPLKLYILPSEQPALLRLDEALGRYSARAETRPLLAGLRCMALPAGFDADDEVAREWMSRRLRERMCSDLLFGVVFGRLSAEEVLRFCAHNGPFGLKYALLETVTREKVSSTGEITARLGRISNSSMREALVMMVALGLIYQKPRAMPWHPTVKGRFLLDLVRLLVLEAGTRSTWSNETLLILNHLGMKDPSFIPLAQLQEEPTPQKRGVLRPFSVLEELLFATIWAWREFNIDPLRGVNREKPMLHSTFLWTDFDHGIPDDPLRAEELGLVGVV